MIVFTGILSKFILGRRLQAFRWIGIFLVIAGLAVVGLCDILNMKKIDPHPNATSTTNAGFFSPEYLGVYNPGFKNGSLVGGANADNHSTSDLLLGDILIVCAQVIVASQMVYEEKFITKYEVPALQAVGWEGTFGFLTLSTLLIPMYFIPVGEKFGKNPRHVLEDAYDGLYQLAHNPLLATAFCGTVVRN